MRGFKHLEVTDSHYEQIKVIQLNNKNVIQEHYLGSRKKLYSNNTLIATLSLTDSLYLGGLSNPQFISFLGMFNKQLYARFNSNVELYDISISFSGCARGKNIESWDNMNVGDYFYNIDLKSAYWQMANKLGYISKVMFDRYIHLDSYKQAKRLCISFLARENNMYYLNNSDNYTIGCDTSVLKGVYQNIRNELYNCIESSIQGIENWIEYNIDGVYVSKNELNIVKDKLKGMGLLYKITECRKLNELEYSYGCKIKRFKRKV
jgi:hypothetical protein